MSEDIAGKKNRVAEVATISAGDPVIGNLIADVMEASWQRRRGNC